jgi:hypothetical protein
MANFKNIVSEKYKELNKKLKHFLISDDINVESLINKNDEYILNIYLNNKKITSAKYEIMGIYNIENNIFTWGNNFLINNKNTSNFVNVIQKSKNIIEKDIFKSVYNDVDYLERILYYLSNNVLYIFQDNIKDLIEYSCYFLSINNFNIYGVINQDIIINQKKHAIYYYITDFL